MDWIIPSDSKCYELDGALDKLNTIFWAQNPRIKNIAVGDIVYIYETPLDKKALGVVGWKCRVLAVKASYEESKSIDDKEFDHDDESKHADSYIKITALGSALGKYDEESRKKLSLDELRKNGLKSNLQGAERVKPQLLKYISSFKVHKLGGLP